MGTYRNRLRFGTAGCEHRAIAEAGRQGMQPKVQPRARTLADNGAPPYTSSSASPPNVLGVAANFVNDGSDGQGSGGVVPVACPIER